MFPVLNLGREEWTVTHGAAENGREHYFASVRVHPAGIYTIDHRFPDLTVSARGLFCPTRY